MDAGEQPLVPELDHQCARAEKDFISVEASILNADGPQPRRYAREHERHRMRAPESVTGIAAIEEHFWCVADRLCPNQ